MMVLADLEDFERASPARRDDRRRDRARMKRPPSHRRLPWGVTFERWVTPEDAELDLLSFARLD
jgi:hypothetical protein